MTTTQQYQVPSDYDLEAALAALESHLTECIEEAIIDTALSDFSDEHYSRDLDSPEDSEVSTYTQDLSPLENFFASEKGDPFFAEIEELKSAYQGKLTDATADFVKQLEPLIRKYTTAA